MKFLRIFLVLAAALPAAVAAQSSAPPVTGAPMRSVATGVYTEIQAARGDTLFQMYCASCHEPTFHNDEQFRMNWFGRSVYDLFKILKTTMPEDNIGGLTDDEYTRVIAYIIKLNGFPAGKDSLVADSAAMSALRLGSQDAGSGGARQRRR